MTEGRPRFAAAVLTILAAAVPAPVQAGEAVLVYAAASVANVVEEIAVRCRGDGDAVKTSFAASSVLAKQIDHGAPVAVFVSANIAWMDYLEQRDLLVENTRARLAGNGLVVVVPVSSPALEGASAADLLAARPDGRVAMGDPDHVPAGVYAKDALEAVGAWADVRGRAARTANVRAALALVETGAVPFGIVYRTDAGISRRVRAAAAFPRGSHPPIVYETALVRGRDTPAARRFFACMRGAEAAAILDRHGFTLAEGDRLADGR